jgi:hypothetical protein
MAKPKRVKSLEQLNDLADQKRAVVLPGPWRGHQGHTPAAWAMHFQAENLYWLLKAGIYEYRPKPKQAKKPQGD